VLLNWPPPDHLSRREARAAYPKRRSSHGNSLRGQNSVRCSEICTSFQRDILRRHFRVRVLHAQPRSPVSASSVSFQEYVHIPAARRRQRLGSKPPGPAESPGIRGVAHVVIANAISPNSTTINAKAGPRATGLGSVFGMSQQYNFRIALLWRERASIIVRSSR
jgi:hypothetical protein